MTDMPVRFTIDARGTGKFRTDISVTMEEPYSTSFELTTDEGQYHGGDASAPTPLATFAASLGACLLTQIRAFSKRLGVPVEGARVHGTFNWTAVTDGPRQPYEARPDSIAISVDLDTDAPADDVRRLMEAAEKGCFVAQTVVRATPMSHRILIRGHQID